MRGAAAALAIFKDMDSAEEKPSFTHCQRLKPVAHLLDAARGCDATRAIVAITTDKEDKSVPRADAFHAGEEKFEAGDITVDKKGAFSTTRASVCCSQCATPAVSHPPVTVCLPSFAS